MVQCKTEEAELLKSVRHEVGTECLIARNGLAPSEQNLCRICHAPKIGHDARGPYLCRDLKPTSPTSAAASGELFSPRFWLLSSSTVLFMASFGMVMPELPAYLRGLGRPDLIGWIVGLFTIGAFVSRFFSGRIADAAGRRPVMMFGTWVAALAGLGYIAVGTIAPEQAEHVHGMPFAVVAFLAVRLLHGLSTGFRPTGTTAYLTDITPLARRGEALGYLGVAGNAGMAAGPALGSWLTVEFGYNAMFTASSALGVAALLMTMRLPESLAVSRRTRWSDLNVLKGASLDWSAWPSALTLLPVAFAFGTFLTLTPDFVESLGYVYKGSFNTIVVAASIAMRFVAGKASDRHGRVPLMIIGTAMLALGMWTFSLAQTSVVATLGAIIYGMSVGINMPTIFAWTADLAREGKVALALGTMLMSLELGIGFGAVLSGNWYAGDLGQISSAYAFCGIFAVVAMIGLIIGQRRMQRA